MAETWIHTRKRMGSHGRQLNITWELCNTFFENSSWGPHENIPDHSRMPSLPLILRAANATPGTYFLHLFTLRLMYPCVELIKRTSFVVPYLPQFHYTLTLPSRASITSSVAPPMGERDRGKGRRRGREGQRVKRKKGSVERR